MTRCEGGDAPSRTQGRGQGQAWRVHQSVDATLGARAQALPKLVSSASQGTMNNVALGGRDPLQGRPFAYYGTVSGGPEVAPTGPASRPSTPTSQIMNTPVKALHMAQPLATLERPIGRGSGREGRRSGWGGMVRPWELVALAAVTIVAQRRASPRGASGEATPRTAACRLLTLAHGQVVTLPG